MKALQNLIDNAKDAVTERGINDPLHITNLDTIDLKEFTREDMIKILWSVRTTDAFGFAVYLGKNSTLEQLTEAVQSIKYDKKISGGRKYIGGHRYTVIIDHSKLSYDRNPTSSVLEHPVVITPRKYRGKMENWLFANIFDGLTL